MYYKIKTTETNLPKISFHSMPINRMKKYIDGDLEFMHFNNFSIVADEAGKLKNLPVNPIASKLAGFKIVGDVLVLTKDVLDTEVQ